MDNAILSQVYSVLDKYGKSYSSSGVLDNLRSWEQNKGSLVELLRKHPNWNEDALAVIIEVTQSREIDRHTVNEYNNSLYQLSTGVGLSYDDAHSLLGALNAAVGTYTKLLPDEQVTNCIKEYCGVSCTAGQKASRVINRICQKYGLDKHPDYNARFAKLADSLNPMQVKRTALLSIHPCDYPEMSNEDNSWHSCHCIREGEYHAGTLSYMNDPVSMIFYTVDEEVTGEYHTAPKRTRQVFCYHNGLLLQSRLYPQTNDEEARDIYRDIVQRTISRCLELPNLWKLHRSMEHVDRYCSTHGDALHYRDYTYDCYKPNISLLIEAHSGDERNIVIGHTAYCLDCSHKLHAAASLYCSPCGYGSDYVACENCGEHIARGGGDDYYVDGSHYCPDCVSWCSHCEEYTRDEVTSVTNRNGYEISVCTCCRDEHYSYCEDCGEYFHIDTGVALDDGFHCSDCLDNRYFTCDRCKDYVLCEEGAEIDGKIHCSDCAGDIRGEQEEVDIDCRITA